VKGHGHKVSSAHHTIHRHSATPAAVQKALKKLAQKGKEGAKVAAKLQACGSSKLAANNFLFPGDVVGAETYGHS